MKRLFIVLALAGVCLFDATAQKNIPETVTFLHNANRRTEIILPQVNGLNVYKADLHTTLSIRMQTSLLSSAFERRGSMVLISSR